MLEEQNDLASCVKEAECGFCFEHGIGTLREKTLHKALKLYIEPDTSKHEVAIAGYVADVLSDGTVYEIQRASFSHLIPKLKAFLPEYNVTVIYPLVVKKRIIRIDDRTSEVVSVGKKIKGKTVYDAPREIYKIKDLLSDDKLTVKLILLDCIEYRCSEKKKRWSKKTDKIDIIPENILGEILLKEKEDYLVFLPEGLGDEFVSADFAELAKSRSRYAYYSLRLLCELGLLQRRRAEKGAYLYSIVKNTED